jgi:hypothetical protein
MSHHLIPFRNKKKEKDACKYASFAHHDYNIAGRKLEQFPIQKTIFETRPMGVRSNVDRVWSEPWLCKTTISHRVMLRMFGKVA